MHSHDTANLVASAAALMERFERRSQQIEHELQQLARQIPTVIRQATDVEMQRLPAAVMGKIEPGMQRSVTDYEQRLQVAGQQLQQASHALSNQIQRLQMLHRQLIWKVAGITLGSLALILLAGGWLSSHYYDEIRRYQLSADLLKAYNAADVTLCDGKLCANVDAKGRKFGEQGQYRPVHDRP